MSKAKNRNGAFRRRVAALDGELCRNPSCLSVNGAGKIRLFTAHHIRYRSKRGAVNHVENGIMLCQECHYAAHNGHGKGDDHVCGRVFMLRVLNALVGASGYRWGEVHAGLRRRYAA